MSYKKNYKYSVTYTEEDDELGDFWVHFRDKVIENISDGEAEMYCYTTLMVDAMIIPEED